MGYHPHQSCQVWAVLAKSNSQDWDWITWCEMKRGSGCDLFSEFLHVFGRVRRLITDQCLTSGLRLLHSRACISSLDAAGFKQLAQLVFS